MRLHAPNPRTPALWLRDLRDRLRGRRGVSLARWGWYRPPGGPGPLLWVYAPDCAAARVGAEIVRGIRSVRRDVRAVVTAAAGACGEAVREVLAGYPGTAVAPAIADHQRAARRAAARLRPSGLLAVHRLPPFQFLKGLAAAGVPLVAVACEPPRRRAQGLRFDHVLPVGEHQARRWRQAGTEPDEAADLEVLLARTDVEPSFRAALVPGGDRRLFWVDHLPEDQRQRRDFLERWADGDRTLVVSGPEIGGIAERPVLRLSEWNSSRAPVPPGTLIWMDEERWLPAVAASAFAGALWRGERGPLWQALASGLPVLAGGEARTLVGDLGIEPDEAVPTVPDWGAVEAQWQHWEDRVFEWRDRQARLRQAFWGARRRAVRSMAVLDAWVDGW